ncbi:MAG: DUF4139 domain-containing protein [Bacteroidota bacterium]|jgi:uncharacterized protein (TIGR02231 family)
METFRYNLLMAALMAWSAVSAQSIETEIRATSTITNVTVFLNQAQITRVAKVNLQAGTTRLVFDRVSPFVNLNSIQVKTESNITLLSVSQRNNFLQNDEKPRFIVELEDTLQKTNLALQQLQIRKEAYTVEKDLLLTNKSLGGANSGVKIDDLEDALTLYRKRTIEIGEELLKLSATELKLQAIRTKLQAQLDEYLGNANSTVEVIVTLKSLQAVTNAKIEWSYLVNNASWSPLYDIRVKDTKNPLQLVNKAVIRQSTGEEWKNVVLKLSTSNPNESGTKPELQTNYLGFRTLDQLQYKRATSDIRKSRADRTEAMPSYEEGAAVQATGNIPQNAITTQTDVNLEFNVTSAYTIPSDNNEHQVDLTISTLNAIYAYAAVPRLTKDAFVTAQVLNNDMPNQVSGPAKIYFDGSYMGESYLSSSTGDTVLLSLGRDKRIHIQRTLLKDFSSKTLSGSSRKEQTTWEITIRNTRKEPIQIVVEDLIPVTTEKEIEVKLVQAGGASYDEATGKLKWVLNIDAEKSHSVRFSFEVKYPKEKPITPY